MSDINTTIHELRQLMQSFVDERDWQQFHSPKNLSMSLAIEAGELMEHFQWLTVEESQKLRDDEVQKQAIGEELADVLCYALSLANAMDLDVATAIRNKMVKNALKYPAEKFRGKSR